MQASTPWPVGPFTYTSSIRRPGLTSNTTDEEKSAGHINPALLETIFIHFRWSGATVQLVSHTSCAFVPSRMMTNICASLRGDISEVIRKESKKTAPKPKVPGHSQAKTKQATTAGEFR